MTDIALQVGVGILSVAGVSFTGGMSVVGAIALESAIKSSGSLLFNGLDALGGYKKVDESLFDFGKSFALNTVSTAGGVIFNGMDSKIFSQGFSNTVYGETTAKILSNSMQIYSTGTVNSLIGGITYNRNDGLGYDSEYFISGMENTFNNILLSSVNSSVNGIFSGLNSGYANYKIGMYTQENMRKMSVFNSLMGGLAEQGVNYAMGNDFTLNLFNISVLKNLGITKNEYNSGLLELHLKHDGSAGMNIGQGGVNISPNILFDSAKAAVMWGSDIITDIYTAINNVDIKYSFQTLLQSGDKIQKNRALKWLFGTEKLIIDNGADYNALTEKNDDEKRKTIIGKSYHDGMTMEEQAALAVILGHEAYRDGIINDQLLNDEELKRAVIAHIDLAERIYDEHKWFYAQNLDYFMESILLDLAREANDMELFNKYIERNYSNDEDFYWRKIYNNGDYQNSEIYREVTLLGGYNREEVEKYNIDNMTNILYESLYNSGCFLFSLMYGLEAITNTDIDAVALNSWMTEYNFYALGTDKRNNSLSAKLMEKVWNVATGGVYNVNLVASGKVTEYDLIKLDSEKDQYIGHLRILDPSNPNAYTHSVMIEKIDYKYNKFGDIVGVKGVYVANPLREGYTFNSRTYYTLDAIQRLDIYKVTTAYRDKQLVDFIYKYVSPMEILKR